MSEAKFIIREPLLDPKEKVLGYELTWQPHGTGKKNSAPDDTAAQIAFVSERLNDPDAGWLLGENQVFLGATPALLTMELLGALPPKQTVLTLRLADFAQTETLLAVKALRDLGFGILLSGADFNAHDDKLLSLVSHLEVHFESGDFRAQAKMYGSLKQSSIRMVARQV